MVLWIPGSRALPALPNDGISLILIDQIKNIRFTNQ